MEVIKMETGFTKQKPATQFGFILSRQFFSIIQVLPQKDTRSHYKATKIKKGCK